MKKHTRIWLQSRGYYSKDMIPDDLWIPCEWCELRAVVDVNHIDPRGMGGSAEKDTPENLIGMCRECHNDFEAKKITKEQLSDKVNLIINKR